MPKNMSPSPAGRRSICWKCERVFQLTPVNMENAKPMCDACGEEIEMLDKYINQKTEEVKKVNPYAAFRSGSLIISKPKPEDSE